MKAIIIDDEEEGRVTLNNYVGRYCNQVKVMDMVDSVEKAIKSIAKHSPDLIFLDIEMPYGNAFDLLEFFDEINFEVIFVTAYKEYAIQALNLSASYYLLKPINIDELILAIDKVYKEYNNKSENYNSKILLNNLQSSKKENKKLVLPQSNGFEVVSIAEIIRIEADNNYSKFYFIKSNPLLISKTLKYYEEALNDFGFVRVHKSHLVNLEYIKRYTKGKTGALEMVDGSSVDVSSSKKTDLISRLT